MFTYQSCEVSPHGDNLTSKLFVFLYQCSRFIFESRNYCCIYIIVSEVHSNIKPPIKNKVQVTSPCAVSHPPLNDRQARPEGELSILLKNICKCYVLRNKTVQTLSVCDMDVVC